MRRHRPPPGRRASLPALRLGALGRREFATECKTERPLIN
jgi:hypothetical protein